MGINLNRIEYELIYFCKKCSTKYIKNKSFNNLNAEIPDLSEICREKNCKGKMELNKGYKYIIENNKIKDKKKIA